MEVCDVCGGQEFEFQTGLAFCHECGTQSQNVMQMDYAEYDDGGGRTNLSSTKIRSSVEESKKDNTTSYEDFNFVLVGYVNTLINLGANEEFKLTVLQLWTAYLRKCEVAFFSEELSMPKLAACFKKKDAEIIYNRPTPIRRRIRNKSTTHNLDKKSKIKKGQAKLLANDYKDFKKTYDDNCDQSILSQMINQAPRPIRLEFSRIARRTLKKQMRKAHIHKHENDHKYSLNCHKFLKPVFTFDIMTQKKIFAFLYIGLNITKDEIQLADLLRYIREGHLPFQNILHFFPESLANKMPTIRYHSQIPFHLSIRQYGAKLCKFINVKQVTKPDFFKLCKRFIQELSLPSDLFTYIKRLLIILPPQILYDNNVDKAIPNYEGRAMAYILFFCKLIFGLDGQQEIILSESATKINNYLKILPSGFEKIFVWSDWVKFIEMRNILIRKNHFPTNIELDIENQETHLYIDYLNNMNPECDDDFEDKKNESFVELHSLGTFLQEFQNYQELKYKDRKHISIQFDHSLTPFNSYLNKLLTDTPNSVRIPKFLKQNFNETFLEYYMTPELLEFICKNNDINVNVNIIHIGLDEKMIKFVHITRNLQEKMKWKEKKANKFYKCFFDKKDILDEGEIIDLNKIDLNESKPNDDFSYVIDCKSNEYINMENNKNNIQSEVNSDNHFDNEPKILNFCVPKFDYWIHMANLYHVTKDQFKDLQTKLPKSFTWLLNLCAKTIEMDPLDLYDQLIIIENYINYVSSNITDEDLSIVCGDNKQARKEFLNNIRVLKKRW